MMMIMMMMISSHGDQKCEKYPKNSLGLKKNGPLKHKNMTI